ncbi:MAG: putative selenium-dependent hydroxylase accessory protein YqeC [Anaerolineales bacterium]|nr:putative selenium-dependent hydroxylase accessory protein YqeC [Anaerolineales bacterium]
MTYNKRMDLAHALRLTSPSASNQTISLVGAGGKTTALFQLARQLSAKSSVTVTATSHLGAWQITLADQHIIAKNVDDLKSIPEQGVTLITGEIENNRTKPVDSAVLHWLHEKHNERAIPLLIEADGSRQKSIKAPAEHEPPIPKFSDVVIAVAGLSTIGKPLTEEHVHRPEIFSHLSGLPIGETITPQAIISVLTHPQGGLKNIPPSARHIVLLNQADTPELQSIGGGMARELLGPFDSIVVGSLQQNSLRTIEHTAGIILAAGQATRYGSAKQLLDWKGKPFVRHIAETALHSGLWPVAVITGFRSADVESCLKDLPVEIVHNPEYQEGQSTSIKAGVASLPQKVGGAVFLLADQPQIPGEVIRALTEAHTKELQPIVAPLVLEERRANPVLFDRAAFPDLLQLTGDVGGRALFSKYKVEYIPWHDDILLFDVDKPEDYQRLVNIEKL